MRAELPTRVLDVELSEPLQAIAPTAGGIRYGRALALVRMHTIPLGTVAVPLASTGDDGDSGIDPERLADLIWASLGSRIREHLLADGIEAPAHATAGGVATPACPACLADRDTLRAHAPLVSVVVATRERVHSLRTCLESLLALDYPNYEILLVDNAPATDGTHALVSSPEFADRVRYLREDRRGLAAAHNHGLAHAGGEIIAFTDDDVAVDRYWLLELARGFRLADRVACVTGLIVAAELETPAQMVAERIWGFNKGFTQRVFDGTTHEGDSLYPYAAGKFGSGANMAFDTAILRAYGGFDPTIGIGTSARGGDDLSAFFTVIAAGDRLVYNPGALVAHHHHSDYSALRRQAFSYGVGLTAYLTKTVVDEPSRLFQLARLWRSGIRRAVDPRPGAISREERHWPADLARAERLGMVSGPAALLWSRVEASRSARSGGQR